MLWLSAVSVTFGLTSDQLEQTIRSNTPGCADFPIAAPSIGSGVVVDASQFGLKTNNLGPANYTALLNAIAYCKTTNAYKLTVPPGTYYIGDYTKKYSNGLLYLNGLTDFILDGQGATFRLQAKAVFLNLNACSRVRIQNLTLGWDWRKENLESLTQVSQVDSNGDWLDLTFPYETNPPVSANVVDLIEVESTNYNFTHQAMGVVGVSKLDTGLTTKPGPANVIRYYAAARGFFTANGAAVGQCYLIRHYEYDFHGVVANSSDNLVYSNLTVYSTLGMGFAFHFDHHYQVVDSKLIREPGTLYHLSASADGIHVANSYGYFKVQNVEIGHAGDDAINIHDTDSIGVTVTGTNSLTAGHVMSWRNPYHVGDRVELRGKDFSPLSPPWSSTLTIVGSYDDNAQTVPLSFAASLPASLDVNTILFNHAYNSDHYIVSGCYVHDNKVRGMITYAGVGTIENNRFIRNFCPGLNILCEARTWQEGINPSNIVVRGNLFDGNDGKTKTFSSCPNNLEIAAETTPVGIVSYPICQWILLESNVVKNCPYAGLEIASATNVLAKYNQFENTNLKNDLSSVQGCISLKQCGGVFFSNNSLLVDPGVTSYKNNVYVASSAANNNVFVGPFVALPPAAPSALLVRPIGNSQIELAWTDNSANETNFLVERKALTAGGFVQIVNCATNVTGLVDAGLAPDTAYAYRLRAGNAAGYSPYTDEAAATTLSSLPGAWASQDIGSVGIPGGAGYRAGSFTINGSGADIWGKNDSFHFVSQSCPGDLQLVARVTAVENTDPWAKAGLMVRQSLVANAAHSLLFLSPGNGVALEGRTTPGGTTATVGNLTNLTAPQWLKLVRRGNYVNAYQSPDGLAWTRVAAHTNNLTGPCVAGLAVTAKNNNVLNTSMFDNVTLVNAGALPQVSGLSAAGSNLVFSVAGGTVTSAPGLMISTNLAGPWQWLPADSFTSTYPFSSNGAYSLVAPLPSAAQAFFRVACSSPWD